MYAFWNPSANGVLPNTVENDARAEEIMQGLSEKGLSQGIGTSGDLVDVPFEELISAVGGAETQQNIAVINTWFNQLRNNAMAVMIAQFRHGIRNYVQADNRSVIAALRNITVQSKTMLDFMINFVGKDVKLPLRFHTVELSSADYGMDPEDNYTEAQTGTYHTLQTLGGNQAWRTFGMYTEDSPVLRRYLRFVDFQARRLGIRLVYCPKTVNHLDEIGAPVRPVWRRDGHNVVREIQTGNHAMLYVGLAFDYDAFRTLGVVETEVQPGQVPYSPLDTNFSPIIVSNLHPILCVLNTLGSFALCKIYYKALRTPVRSSPAAQS